MKMSPSIFLGLVIAGCFMQTSLYGEIKPGKTASLPRGPEVKKLQDGLFQIGHVMVDARKKKLSLPVRLNMSQGPIEYGLVVQSGKAYESLLVTDEDPHSIHIGMLLLGVEDPTVASRKGEGHAEHPGNFIDADYLKKAPKLKGKEVTLEIRWSEKEKTRVCFLEELVSEQETSSPLARGSWTYSGSVFEQETFLAQKEGSIVAIVTDPAALINNPRPIKVEDGFSYYVNTKSLPPKDAKLELIVCLKGEK